MKIKIKIIIGQGFALSKCFEILENRVNKWLDQNVIDVVDVKYQDNSSYCSCLIIYKEK